MYTSLTRPTLYQTDRTCETSPGSPSGHLMVASSFFYVMLLAGEKLIVLHCRSCRRIMRYIARLIFAATLALLSVSRMYFATHFLHQCVLGAVLGISIAEILIFTTFTENVQDFDKQKWFKIACGMAASVVIIFWFLKWFTGNPMASVHMVRRKLLLGNNKRLYFFSSFRHSSIVTILCTPGPRLPLSFRSYETLPKWPV